MYMIDADDPSTPRFVGYEYGIAWLENDYILAISNGGIQPMITQLSTATTRPFFRDSMLILYVGKDGLLGYEDWRQSVGGWWTTRIAPSSLGELFKLEGDTLVPRIVEQPRRIAVTPGTQSRSDLVTAASAAGVVVDYTVPGVFTLMSFRERTRRAYTVSFQRPRRLSMDISSDGKEVTFSINRINARLVLAENVFE